jgi:hypothetical protein
MKGKYICSITEIEKNGKYDVTLWYVEKEKPAGRFFTSNALNRVDVNPKNPAMFSISGANFFKLYVYDANEKTFTENKETENIFQLL